MNDISIASDSRRGVLVVRTEGALPKALCLRDASGRPVAAAARPRGPTCIELDAENLQPWTPDTPVLYTLDADGQSWRFGYIDLRPDGAGLRLNGMPFYARGFIRGITAHDHPNLTGGSARDGFAKGIRQAKRYGFNLVRFHSTIPDPEFVDLADEMGLFIHMEIGYRHEYGADGKKKGIVIDEQRWRDAIRRYRNHPSVAIFCLGNEMHRAGHNPEAARMVRIGRELAPGKLIVDNAGWGEFDRDSADVFIQHIAYYFPYRKHAAMFQEDVCWAMNGSVHDEPLTTEPATPTAATAVRRRLNPVRPVLAHECIHYIILPDYEALRRKFDDFAARVGDDYLRANGIERPRYLDALPRLIAEKGLTARMPDAIAASSHFRRLAIKTYLERLRLAGNIAGFEMLQFADCLKYENKNGLVDAFDDDRDIDPAWLRQVNDDVVLLAEVDTESCWSGEPWALRLHLSNYAPQPLGEGILELFLEGPGQPRQRVYHAAHVVPVSGVSLLAEVTLRPTADAPGAWRLEAELRCGDHVCRNDWTLHVFPRRQATDRPTLRLADAALAKAVESVLPATPARTDLVLTDSLDNPVFADLDAGRTVILNYHRDQPANRSLLPAVRDRFKPCIWDRGSHLGGVIDADWLRQALGGGRFFDKHCYDLIEGACKINLDLAPFPVDEWVWGVDKPVRDRMKGLIHGIKDFLPGDTLRNFSYLFSLRVGNGTLWVCTFRFTAAATDPASAAGLAALLDQAPRRKPARAVTRADLETWCRQTAERGQPVEDVMNRFWEQDNRPVEDTLFWEEAKVDLSRMSRSSER